MGNKADWWTAEDKAKFLEKQEQMINRYNELEQYPGVMADGKKTLGENIADLGGFSMAYQMWNEKLQADGLTGEALRHQQRQFFVSYADYWQCNEDEKLMKNMLETDVHSANHNRANGIARLMDDWYTLFSVEPGDKLYVKPADRVKIW
jgi:predicted metalloendopeptidase